MNRKAKVILQPVKFRKNDHVAVLSLYNPGLDEIIRNFDDAEWSTGYRFWHLPLKQGTIDFLSQKLKKVAVVDSTAFNNFHYHEKPQQTKPVRTKLRINKLNTNLQEELKEIEKNLVIDGYSNSSAKVFVSLLKVFFYQIKDRDIKSVSYKEATLIITNYIDHNSLSFGYKKMLLSAVQKYYSLKNIPIS